MMMNKILLLTLLFAALLSMNSAANLKCKLCNEYDEDGRCKTRETSCRGPSHIITCMRITFSDGTGKSSCASKEMCEDIRDRNKDPNKHVLCCETNLCNEMQPWSSPTSTPSDSSPTEGP